jgi:hypothetical protein
LRAYLQAHPEAFAVEPRFTFRQVYLDPLRRGAHLARDVDRLLAELQRIGNTTDLAALGDVFLLAHEVENVSANDVRKIFGDPFAAGLSALTPWHALYLGLTGTLTSHLEPMVRRSPGGLGVWRPGETLPCSSALVLLLRKALLHLNQ